MKKILSFLLLGLICSIGNLWAVNLPETVWDLNEANLGENWKHTAAATYIKSDNIFLFHAYELYQSSSAYQTWTDNTNSGSSSATWDAMTPFPANTSWTGAEAKSAKLNESSGGPYCYRVTNCEKVYIMGKSGSNKKRTVYLRAYEVTNNEPAEIATAESSFEANDNTVISIDIDDSKEYVIEVSQVGSGTGGSSGGNSNYYAIAFQYSATTYVATYKANGSGEEDVIDYEARTVAANPFSWAQHAFTGWNTTADGTGAAYAVGAALSADITLYAQWEEALAVNFDLQGHGDAIEAQYIISGNKVAEPAAPTADGYVFGGWYKEAACVNEWNFATDVVSAATILYAKWDKVCYNAIYDLVEGVGSAEVTADDATVNDGESLVLSNTAGRIKLTPADGKKFRSGDRITFSGIIGNTSKNYGVKVFASDNKTSAGNFYVEGTTDPLTVSGTLTLAADQDYLYIGRYDGTTTTLTSCVISQPGECPDMYVATYHANGSGEADVVDDEAIKVAANPFEYAGHTFLGWNTAADGTGEDVAVGTSLSADIELYAQWQASFVVSYYNGAELLGSEEVIAGASPVEATSIKDAIQLVTFNGWFSDAELTSPVDPAAAVISANTNFYASITPIYASSINIEQLVLDNSISYDIMAQMGTLGYASNMTNDLDALNDEKSKRNEPYLGQKIKAAGKLLNFRVAAGNTVLVKFGNIGTTPQVSINGGEYANMEITDNVYTYVAEADALISIKTVDGKTVVLKQIVIGVNPQIADVVLPATSAEITLGTNGWSTYAATYDFTVTGATVYIAKVNNEGNAVILTEVKNAVVPAEAGIVLKGAEDAIVTISSSTDAVSDFSDNELVGTISEKTATTNMYVITTNEGVTEFNPCENKLKIPAHKAYLEIESENPAPLRVIFAENNATAIDNIEGADDAVKFVENGVLYIRRNGVVYTTTGQVVR